MDAKRCGTVKRKLGTLPASKPFESLWLLYLLFWITIHELTTSQTHLIESISTQIVCRIAIMFSLRCELSSFHLSNRCLFIYLLVHLPARTLEYITGTFKIADVFHLYVSPLPSSPRTSHTFIYWPVHCIPFLSFARKLILAYMLIWLVRLVNIANTCQLYWRQSVI